MFVLLKSGEIMQSESFWEGEGERERVAKVKVKPTVFIYSTTWDLIYFYP